MSLKRILPLLLIPVLLAGLISGCAGAPASQTEPAESADATAETTGVPVTEAPSTAAPTAEPTSGPDPELPAVSWAAAFHDSSLPEGTLTADSAAFLRKNGDGTVDVFNVPLDEVLANRPAYPPRSHFFEQYMPQELNDELRKKLKK